MNDRNSSVAQWLAGGMGILLIIGLLVGAYAGMRAFGRYQRLQEARNDVEVNRIKIAQTEQLVQIERQQADVRRAEAEGIADAQRIINATLTDKYLTHEAIQAQRKMADSPNHTTVYIPSGQMGLPLVKTVDGDQR